MLRCSAFGGDCLAMTDKAMLYLTHCIGRRPCIGKKVAGRPAKWATHTLYWETKGQPAIHHP